MLGKKSLFIIFFNLVHNFIQHLKIIQVALQPNNKIFIYAPLCLTSAFNVRNCPTSSIETMKLTCCQSNECHFVIGSGRVRIYVPKLTIIIIIIIVIILVIIIIVIVIIILIIFIISIIKDYYYYYY